MKRSKRWLEIWDGRGMIKNDLIKTGYLDFDPKGFRESLDLFWRLLLKKRNLQSVLEVGCGCGFALQRLGEIQKFGLDYSFEMLDSSNSDFYRINGEACSLPFKPGSFDGVFSFSVFQYFNSLQYAEKVLNQMLRLARKFVWVLDVPDIAFRDKRDHLFYSKDWFRQRGGLIFYWRLPFYQHNWHRFDVEISCKN